MRQEKLGKEEEGGEEREETRWRERGGEKDKKEKKKADGGGEGRGDVCTQAEKCPRNAGYMVVSWG